MPFAGGIFSCDHNALFDCKNNLAKVGVEGSNPFARSSELQGFSLVSWFHLEKS
jgi:hypothetical protein